MRWRTRLSPGSPTANPRSRRGLRGTQRLAIVAGLAAVLVVSLLSIAFAGVFAGSARAAASKPAHAPHRTAPAHQSRHARPGHVRTARRTAAHTRTGASARGLQTSCTSVAHVGDSTSVGMVSPTWLSNPAQRMAAQYRDVGVRHAQIDASGGRSIVEELPGQINGFRVASGWYQAGF